MAEEWITAETLWRRLDLRDAPRTNHRVRELVGHGLLRVRCLSARGNLEKFARQSEFRNWEIDRKFLSGSSVEPSRAHIDVFADRLSSRLGSVLDGDPQIEAVGLEFEVSEIVQMLKPTPGGAVVSPAPVPIRPGPPPDAERWSDFGAALAFIAYTEGLEGYRGRSKLYEAVALKVSNEGGNPLDEKLVRNMLDKAVQWSKNDK